MLASSSLEKSINYWNGILGLTIYEKTDKSATFGFAKTATKIQLKEIGKLHSALKRKYHVSFKIN